MLYSNFKCQRNIYYYLYCYNTYLVIMDDIPNAFDTYLDINELTINAINVK